MTVTAHLHGGDRDGETIDLEHARLELLLPLWSDVPLFDLKDVKNELYKLRPPWRGQAWAHYDFVKIDEKLEAA